MSVLHGIFDAPTALGTSIQTKDRRCEAACQSLECVLDCISMRKNLGSWYDDTLDRTNVTGEQYGGELAPGKGKIGSEESGSTESQGACNSRHFIEAVQESIGAEPDGVWGPKSQAALNATGKKFNDFVNCTPPVPSASASTGGGTSISTGGGTSISSPAPSSVSPPGESQAGMTGGIMDTFKQDFMGIPVGVWGVGIAVVTAVTIAVGKQKNWW